MEDSKKSDKVAMNEWRNYFKNGNGNGDIFEIIKRAIMVAASDHPTEFLINRDNIAQTLFSCHVEQQNIGSMKIDHPNVNNQDIINNSSSHGDTEEQQLVVHHHEDQEAKMNAEVLKIKQILDRDESVTAVVVYEWLWKLQEMGLCFKTLEATGIGRSVSGFQNHASTDVRQIARRLIKKWRAVVDEWINATENTSCVVQEQKQKQKEDNMIIKGAAEKEMVSMGMKKESTNVVKIKIKRNSEKAKMDDNGSISVEKKLEASKRKLHQRYEEAENAKRQRKIQVMELHQLKKQGLVIPKTNSQIRKWGKYLVVSFGDNELRPCFLS